MKRKIYVPIIASLALLCSACSSLNLLSLEMLNPAELSFPPAIRTVAVVDNVSFSDTLLTHGITVGTMEGDGRVLAQQLAQRLSESEYFNEVILCDSSLRRGDHRLYPATLSEQQVTELTADLQADLLLVVDELGLTTEVYRTRMESVVEGIPVLEGVAQARFSLYVPGRATPLRSALAVQDTLQWYLVGNLNEREMVDRVGEQLARRARSLFVPEWHPVERFYYGGGNVSMRDAAFFVRENQWDEAKRLWTESYESSKPTSAKRMQTALNLALCAEVQGEMEEATSYAEEALRLAKPGSTDQQLIQQYLQRVLGPKGVQMQKLRLQMERFNEK